MGLLGLLTACSSGLPKPTPAAGQPLARLSVATPDAEHDLVGQLLTAELALGDDDLPTAARAYAQAAVLSNEALVARRATELALTVGDYAQANRSLARWRQLGGAPQARLEAQATLDLAQGRAVAAREELRQLVAGGRGEDWARVGRVLLGSRDPAAAAMILESIATPQQLPSEVRIWLMMSALGEKLGRPHYALTVAQSAVRRFHSAETYAWCGQLEFQAGRHAEGRVLLRRAMRLDPANVRWRLLYAGLLSQAGDIAAASRLLDTGPQDSHTFELRTALAVHANDRAGVEQIYRELRRARPAIRDNSRYLLGQLAEMLGRNDEALRWYGEVGSDDPHAFDAGLRRALLLAAMRQTAAAHAQLAQMQVDDLDFPDQLRMVYEMDGDLYMRDAQYTQAATAYGQALLSAPADAGLLYERSLAYAEGGETDAAIADLRQVLLLKPNDVDASNALGYTLADSGRNLAEAGQLLSAARAARPDDPAIDDSWGWLQYRLGHLDEAQTVLHRAWQASHQPDIGVHLGEVLWQQGQRDQARTLFEAVRRDDPHNPVLLKTLSRLHP